MGKKEEEMSKLTPKETNIIDDIVRSVNPLFFGKLVKLLDLPFPVTTLEEKIKVLMYILEVWRNRHV